MKKLSGLIIFVLFALFSCKKNGDSRNITLHDKSLSIIQHYIEGKWKLNYTKGGYCGTCIYPAKYNQYAIFSSEKISLGNDSNGVVVDTFIRWKKDVGIFYGPTYLLTYYYPGAYGSFPIAYIVDGIYNDTLKLIDNANDPFFYYYTKLK